MLAQMKNLYVNNTMIKGNQRLNGFIKSPTCGSPLRHKYITTGYYSSRDSINHIELVNDNATNHNSYETEPVTDSNEAKSLHETKLISTIKDEPHEEDFESKITIHSIIGIGNEDSGPPKVISSLKPRIRKGSFRATHHETLQRIDRYHGDQHNHYQRQWFSAGLERLKLEDRSREERLEITRYELKRHLKQLIKCNVGKDARLPSLIEWRSYFPHMGNVVNDRLVVAGACDTTDCKRPALPCARHCTLHIMHNPDQVLFSNCTAKFADNTQCSVPVFDVQHELPLCVEHARKRDNYQMYQEAKPKKLRKKVKPSAMIRPRSKKKKKSISSDSNDANNRTLELSAINMVENAEISDEIMTDVPDEAEEIGDDMVEQVLALQEPDVLELATVEQVLVNQATHLLEESDITNVLSTIQGDVFNDLFLVNRNGEYEPTREETEELERALAAVDNDVKSLEKLTQSQGLLDPFLDVDHSLVESLVQASIQPDVYHNGYAAATTCGDNILVGQTPRLLSVQPTNSPS